MTDINGTRHVHDFLVDSEGNFEGISPDCLVEANSALPKYTGTTDGDRANYLFENADQLAAEAVTSARQRIDKVRSDGYLVCTDDQADAIIERAFQLIDDPDSVMDAARPECNVLGGSRMIETAPEAARFMSDLQRADEMSETREERVGAIADEVWANLEEMREEVRGDAIEIPE